MIVFLFPIVKYLTLAESILYSLLYESNNTNIRISVFENLTNENSQTYLKLTKCNENVLLLNHSYQRNSLLKLNKSNTCRKMIYNDISNNKVL